MMTGRRCPACCGASARPRRAAGDPREGSRRLADWSWRAYFERVRDFARGPRRARLRAWRQARGDRRQPPAPLRGATRGAGVGRRGRAGLPGFHRDELAYVLAHAETSSWWPRTRSRSTRCFRCSARLPDCAARVYEDPRGMYDYRADSCCRFSAVEAAGQALLVRDAGLSSTRDRSGRRRTMSR